MKDKEEIIVYWAPVTFNVPYLSFTEPTPAIKELKLLCSKICGDNPSNQILKCPSVVNGVRNTFAISSPINLKIDWDGDHISSIGRNQEFFDRTFLVRNVNSGFFSLKIGNYAFFTEEPYLLMKQKTAVYSANDFIKKAGIFEGIYDIGQWFRPLDLAVYFKEPGIINIDKEDILYYIEFFTEKKIVFKKFVFTSEIEYTAQSCISIKSEINFPIKTYLKNLYLLFNQSKIKSRILKNIKENLLE